MCDYKRVETMRKNVIYVIFLHQEEKEASFFFSFFYVFDATFCKKEIVRKGYRPLSSY